MRSVGERCARFAMRPTIEKSITASQHLTTQVNRASRSTLLGPGQEVFRLSALSQASHRARLPQQPLSSLIRL